MNPRGIQKLYVALAATTLSIFLTAMIPDRALAGVGKVGGEWTFSNQWFIDSQRNFSTQVGPLEPGPFRRKIKAWMHEIQAKCPTCEFSSKGFGSKTVYTVRLRDQIAVNFQPDPYVIEVTADPKSTSELKNPQLRVFMQEIIWNSAKEVGLVPQARIGGGHLHLDIETHFQNDRLLFRNFIVDLANHPELFMGALSLDYLNAPPLAILTRNQRRAFKNVISDFDSSQMTIAELKSEISSRVYTTSFLRQQLQHQSRALFKYQAVNLMHAQTVEIRGLRPQTDFDHFLLMTDLFESRIAYLKKVPGPIAYNEKDYSGLVTTKTTNDIEEYRTDLSASQILSTYQSFVQESGLNWEVYKNLVTEELKSNHLFKRNASRVACEGLFQVP